MNPFECRLCGENTYVVLADFGTVAYTGVFPRPGEHVESGELKVVACTNCALSQLSRRFDPAIMYGPTYGYRSGLSGAMVTHLQDLARRAGAYANLQRGDTVLDIGCSDGTLLSAFHEQVKVGFDPVVKHLDNPLPSDILAVPDFFSEAAYWNTGMVPPKLVTAVAMFYDLDDPVDFLSQIRNVIHDQGMLCLELQYTPLCLQNRAVDFVCHEHAVYYDANTLKTVLAVGGFEIVQTSLNYMNGGSIRVYAKPRNIVPCGNSPDIKYAFNQWQSAMQDVMTTGERIKAYCRENDTVGLGASTKGNVLLNLWGLNTELLPMIGEINANKFGCETPGTHIPIVDELDLPAGATRLVFPWWAKDSMTERYQGHRLLFPLPKPVVWENDKEYPL